jgi:hypothetical protein
MILISHRGNVSGPMDSWENEPTYIDLAISKGYDVEVDVWIINRIPYLGHDKPLYGMDFKFFEERSDKLWIHCKNMEAFKYFIKIKEFNIFYHTEEKVVLTSKGIPWYYTGEDSSGGICVLPELHNNLVPEKSIGICSDYIEKFVDI